MARELSAVGQRLAAALVAGEQLDLIPDLPRGELPDEAGMRAWGPEHDLPAEELVDLLRGLRMPDGEAAHPRGVRMRGARIVGRLALDFVVTALPLALDQCLLDDGISARNAKVRGLSLTGCRITHASAVPLDAEGLVLEHHLVLETSQVTASGGADNAVGLRGASLAGDLDCTGARLHHATGPALNADGLQVHGSVFLRGVTAYGKGDLGAVRLLDGSVTGVLVCSGARLRNDSGPALHADRIQVHGSVFLNQGFTADGGGDLGAVRLLGATVTGQLNFHGGARLTNRNGSALSAQGASVSGSVLLDDLVARGSGRVNATIDLRSGRFGQLSIPPTQEGGVERRWGRERTARIGAGIVNVDAATNRWDLDGCTYGGLPWPENRAGWVTLLREATPQYDPQPYQQLAKVYREAGHDRDVRQILMAQRRDQVRWGSLTLSERTWARFTGLTLGYGWQPWRALIGLVGVFVASVVLTLALGSHGALVKGPLGTAAPSAPCTRLEMVGVGLDLGTPVLGSAIKARERCPINPDPASATATALTVATLILQFMAWALAALFIAGFTGAVRKT